MSFDGQRQLIHVYDEPPVVGSRAICGYEKTDDMEGFVLHSESNQCAVCTELAATYGLTLVARDPTLPEGYWRIEK